MAVDWEGGACYSLSCVFADLAYRRYASPAAVPAPPSSCTRVHAHAVVVSTELLRRLYQAALMCGSLLLLQQNRSRRRHKHDGAICNNTGCSSVCVVVLTAWRRSPFRHQDTALCHRDWRKNANMCLRPVPAHWPLPPFLPNPEPARGPPQGRPPREGPCGAGRAHSGPGVCAEQACPRTSSSTHWSPGCPLCTSRSPPSRSRCWRPWRAPRRTPRATLGARRRTLSRAPAWTTARCHYRRLLMRGDLGRKPFTVLRAGHMTLCPCYFVNERSCQKFWADQHGLKSCACTGCHFVRV